jgi:predicted ATPase
VPVRAPGRSRCAKSAVAGGRSRHGVCYHQGMTHGFRIVVTGGPGGGKTTAADLFRRELGSEVVVVPEAATLLFGGGFPRYPEPNAVRVAQRVIFQVQRGLEDTQRARYPSRILLCDRGTIDGACYWPSTDPDDFFASVGTTLEAELTRYDAVIFFQSAAVGGHAIEANNPVRIESDREAAELDARLRELWSRHPRFVLVPNNQSFFKKITAGLSALEAMVRELRGREPDPGQRV